MHPLAFDGGVDGWFHLVGNNRKLRNPPGTRGVCGRSRKARLLVGWPFLPLDTAFMDLALAYLLIVSFFLATNLDSNGLMPTALVAPVGLLLFVMVWNHFLCRLYSFLSLFLMDYGACICGMGISGGPGMEDDMACTGSLTIKRPWTLLPWWPECFRCCSVCVYRELKRLAATTLDNVALATACIHTRAVSACSVSSIWLHSCSAQFGLY